MVRARAHGWIFDIQRFSLHDGPGIRTTVFLKGCPLRCEWCHNPEGLEGRPQIRLSANLCLRCGRCAAVCGHGCHSIDGDMHLLSLGECVLCGSCVGACPAGAVEIVGRRVSVEDVMAVVRRDIPFYDRSGGGMTLSGGEPLAQFGFSKALLAAGKAEGMHTAVETAAYAAWRRLEDMAPLVGLFLVDLKHTDDARHRQLTGVSNRRILSNIRRMVEAKWPVVLRICWVPQRNVEESFLGGLERFLTSLTDPPPVEFLLYHRLGIGKWSALGGSSAMPRDIAPANAEDITPWTERLRSLGISVKVA